MNIYMGYSRSLGAHEGAALIFAHSIREARAVGWRSCGALFTDEYIDFAATRIRNKSWLFGEAIREKLEQDKAHAVDDPRCCRECELWGVSPIGANGRCEDCEFESAAKIERINDENNY
jgi:hypothetical protein